MAHLGMDASNNDATGGERADITISRPETKTGARQGLAKMMSHVFLSQENGNHWSELPRMG